MDKQGFEQLQKNLNYKIEGNTLTIQVDLATEIGPSKSGKTLILSTSRGNQPLGPDLYLGFNLYRKR